MKNIKMFGRIYGIIGAILFISFLGGFLYEVNTNKDFVNDLQMRESEKKQKVPDYVFTNSSNVSDQGVREYSEDYEELRKVSYLLLTAGIIIWAINIRKDLYDVYLKIMKKFK